jgi:hypothetical protein
MNWSDLQARYSRCMSMSTEDIKYQEFMDYISDVKSYFENESYTQEQLTESKRQIYVLSSLIFELRNRVDQSSKELTQRRAHLQNYFKTVSGQ